MFALLQGVGVDAPAGFHGIGENGSDGTRTRDLRRDRPAL
jgi:hypothetical protein